MDPRSAVSALLVSLVIVLRLLLSRLRALIRRAAGQVVVAASNDWLLNALRVLQAGGNVRTLVVVTRRLSVHPVGVLTACVDLVESGDSVELVIHASIVRFVFPLGLREVLDLLWFHPWRLIHPVHILGLDALSLVRAHLPYELLIIEVGIHVLPCDPDIRDHETGHDHEQTADSQEQVLESVIFLLFDDWV